LRTRVRVFAAACLAVAACFLVVACNRSEAPSKNQKAVNLCDEGTADLQAFRFQDAVTKLGQCLEMDPALAEAAISRALAYANLQENENARRELARADSLTAAITNEKRRLLAQLRLSRMEASRFHAMGESLRDRMEHQEPDNFFVLEAKAARAANSNDPETAIAIWRRILDINPNHAAAYNQVGYLEFNRGNYEAALEQLQKYIFMAPELANPHDSYGEVLMTLGRYEEAEEEFRLSVRMQSDFYPSLINLGRTYLARGKVAKGVLILDRVRHQIAGTEVERAVDLRILTSYLVAEQWDQILTVSHNYIVRYPQAPLTPMLRAMNLANGGQSEQGTAIMDSTLSARRASHRYQDSEQIRRATELLAQQFEGFKQDQFGDGPAAAIAWSRTVELMASNTPYHGQFFQRARLANSLLVSGRPDAALTEIDPMLAVNPRLINVLILKVQAHLDKSQAEAAAAAQEQLTWALSGADVDYAPRARATELAGQINALSLR